MEPKQSYRIWFTPRTGSTLLCKGLESTGIAGKPGEYLTLFGTNSLCEQHQVARYEELKDKIWELGTSSNGVLGIKNTLHSSRSDKKFQEILQLRNKGEGLSVNREKVWADIFPNCKHIFLTRRNKIRQAVSWWKAIQNNVWHIENGEKTKQEFSANKYDFDALSHLFKEAFLMECATQEYFKKYNIIPLNIVYEDYIQDFEGTIRRIIDFLEVDVADYEVGNMFYKPTADENSEIWVQRFRNDFQAQMEEKPW